MAKNEDRQQEEREEMDPTRARHARHEAMKAKVAKAASEGKRVKAVVLSSFNCNHVMKKPGDSISEGEMRLIGDNVEELVREGCILRPGDKPVPSKLVSEGKAASNEFMAGIDFVESESN